MKYAFLSLVLLLSVVAMIPAPASQATTSKPALAAKAHLKQQLQELDEELLQLTTALKQNDWRAAQKHYAIGRTYFKQVEFLIAYLDPHLYQYKLNESPLLKPKPMVANKEVHKPIGWQVLDEALYAEKQVAVDEALALVQTLRQDLQDFATSLHGLRFYDALIIHSIKEELIRAFTLGITGFDTPASEHAMTDFKAVHDGIKQFLDLYTSRFPEKELQALIQHLRAIEYVDFDAFDRYTYLVAQLIPMLECLENIRTTTHLESKEELQQVPLPVNSSFTNPFSADFLRAAYYVQLPPEEITPTRIDLGKQLFNDPLLSSSLKTACATCHNSKHAFTDQLARSQNGDQTATTLRNSPSLNYAVYSGAYFYDLRAHELQNQFDHVIHDTKEFNTNYAAIIKKLEEKETYKHQFKGAYQSYPKPINVASINHALKCYLASLPSFTAPFDLWVQQKEQAIPAEVRQGFNLFMGKAQCATCHFPPTFSGLVPPAYVDSESEVLGVLVDENYEQPVLDSDRGRIANGIVKDNFDFFEASFKTVSIRNIALTAPYMHNGAIKSLEKVVEFYNLGGGAGMGLSLPHQTLPAAPLNLTTAEKQALIAFMKALTDKDYEQ